MTDPEIQKRIEVVKAAMERVRSGESDGEEVEMPTGGKVRLVKDEDSPGGIHFQVLEEPQEGAVKPEPDPARREMMERVQAASERMKSGESDQEEIVLSGGETVRMSRDPEVPGAFVVESTREGSSFRSWSLEGLEERPAGYPEDIPFVPGTSVSISQITPADGSSAPRTVAWMNPPDPDQALEAVKTQLRGDGWVEGEKSVESGLHGPRTGYAFEKGGQSRQLFIMAFGPMSQIMLMEKGEEGDPA